MSKNMDIIKPEQRLFAVPDFWNIAVLTKILVFSMFAILVLPMFAGKQFDEDYVVWMVSFATWICPATILSVLFCLMFNNLLKRMKYGPFLVWIVTTAIFAGSNHVFNFNDQHKMVPGTLTASLLILMLLRYVALVQHSLVDSVTKARLNALTARIRPHFLFNSLNAAISLIRSKPAEAEIVLENLAELFREQLKDSSQASNLKKEVDLAKGYIQIEQFRMGVDRLRTRWEVSAPDDAQTPHLLLQPLLENAVYHGIEPSSKGGCIDVRINFKRGWIYIVIDNPIPENPNVRHREGNKMAMVNLIERLKLMYDADATLATKEVDRKFQVVMRIPYRTDKFFNKRFKQD